MKNRLYQFLFIVTFVPLCWLAMMAVHELGHVLGIAATGGRVARVVLYPLSISRVDLAHNPHPLAVVWAGPVFGVLFPIAIFIVGRDVKQRWTSLIQFFAGFCLISNGVYIAVGSFDGVGDCSIMIHNGSPIWLLWLFGLVTVPFGMFLWHRLGTLAEFVRNLTARLRGPACWSCGLLFIVLVLEFTFSPR